MAASAFHEFAPAFLPAQGAREQAVLALQSGRLLPTQFNVAAQCAPKRLARHLVSAALKFRQDPMSCLPTTDSLHLRQLPLLQCGPTPRGALSQPQVMQ